MKLASWKKGKGVVRGKMGDGRGCSCETGVRPSFEWNSLQGSEFRRVSVALWLAEERWNENHSKLLTPAQELCRNAQRQLWRGGTEPALFLCLLHQSNRDSGEREEEVGGREHIEGGEKDTRAKGRKGRENRQSLWKWMFFSWVAQLKRVHKHCLLKLKPSIVCLYINVRSFYVIHDWHIFTLNYVKLNEISVLIESASVAIEDLCVIRLGSMVADQSQALWLSR